MKRIELGMKSILKRTEGPGGAMAKGSKEKLVGSMSLDEELTLAEVSKRSGLASGTAYRLLTDLIVEGRVHRVGKGSKKDPHRFILDAVEGEEDPVKNEEKAQKNEEKASKKGQPKPEPEKLTLTTEALRTDEPKDPPQPVQQTPGQMAPVVARESEDTVCGFHGPTCRSMVLSCRANQIPRASWREPKS